MPLRMSTPLPLLDLQRRTVGGVLIVDLHAATGDQLLELGRLVVECPTFQTMRAIGECAVPAEHFEAVRSSA